MSRRAMIMLGRGICALVVLAASGCADIPLLNAIAPSKGYATPPTAARLATAGKAEVDGRPIVVIGRFAPPPSATFIDGNVGGAMSTAIARQLGARGHVNVWENDAIADAVNAMLAKRGRDREQALLDVRQRHPQVEYVLTGRVTDFLHTSQLSETLRRTRRLGRTNAVVAIDATLVDLSTGRIVMSDHVYGANRASEDPVDATYRGLSAESYLFWSTPLGLAANDAIDTLLDRMRTLLPAELDEIRITKLIGARRLALYGGGGSLVKGDTYYLARHDWRTGELVAVLDTDLHRPLRARVDNADPGNATAWLLGEPPRAENLRGLLLVRDRPADAPKTVTAPPTDAPLAAAATRD